MLNKIIICVSEENITDKSFDEFKKNAAAEGIVAVREADFDSICVCDGGVYCESVNENAAGSVGLNNAGVKYEGSDKKDTLVITDRCIDDDIVNGWFCAGYGADYSGRVRFVLEDIEDIPMWYLRLVYARISSTPLKICETDNLIIREMTVNDLDDMYKLYDTLKGCPYIEPLYEYEEELEFTRNYIKSMYGFFMYGLWLVFDKRSGEIVGRAGIENREIDGVMRQELGYLIGSKWQRKGYGYEAAKAVMDYAFRNLGIDKLFLCTHIDNKPSAALCRKLGFELFAGDVDGMDVYINYGAKL